MLKKCRNVKINLFLEQFQTIVAIKHIIFFRNMTNVIVSGEKSLYIYTIKLKFMLNLKKLEL